MKIRLPLVALAAALATSAVNADHYYGHRVPVYGNQYGNDTNSYRLYSPSGKFRGNLNDNRYDSNSISNPYGRYGSRYSNESINNPYLYEEGGW